MIALYKPLSKKSTASIPHLSEHEAEKIIFTGYSKNAGV